MNTKVEDRFADFYEKWMGQLEDHLRLVLVMPRENCEEAICQAMVNKLTAHHKAYYTFKWASAHEDVLAFFSPVWLSPLETAYLWVTGWKPSTAFRLLESLKKAEPRAAMTEEQLRKIDVLRVKIKAEEERVEREMERQQVGMADRNIVELARLHSLVRSGADSAAVSHVNGLVEAAVRGLLAGLEKVMKMADCVRLKTLKGVLDVLNPMQCLDFLAATSMLQIQMKKWGKNRDQSWNQ